MTLYEIFDGAMRSLNSPVASGALGAAIATPICNALLRRSAANKVVVIEGWRILRFGWLYWVFVTAFVILPCIGLGAAIHAPPSQKFGWTLLAITFWLVFFLALHTTFRWCRWNDDVIEQRTLFGLKQLRFEDAGAWSFSEVMHTISIYSRDRRTKVVAPYASGVTDLIKKLETTGARKI